MKFILVLLVFKVFTLPLSGQCPDRGILWKHILFLRDSTKTPADEQLADLESYLPRLDSCYRPKDSTKALLLQRAGWLYIVRKDYFKAIELIRKSISLFRSDNMAIISDQLLLARNYNNLRICYDSLNQDARSREAADSCLNIALRVNNAYNFTIPLLYNKVLNLFETGDYSRCVQYAAMGDELASTHFSEIPYGDFYKDNFPVWKFNALLESGRVKEAEENISSRIEGITHALGSSVSLGAMYGLYGKVLVGKKEYKKALSFFLKSYQFNLENNKAACAEALNNIGYMIYFQSYSDFSSALKYYFKALKYADNEESPNIYSNIATIYVSRNLFDSAFYFFKIAFRQLDSSFTGGEMPGNMEKFLTGKNSRYLAGLILDEADAYLKWYKFSGKADILNKAIRTYKLLDRFIDFVRLNHQELGSKLAWRANYRRLYSNALEASYLAKDAEGAFYFFEKGKAVLLAEEIRDRQFLGEKNIARIAQLKKDNIRFAGQLNSISQSDTSFNKLQSLIYFNNEEIGRLKNLVRQINPLYYQSYYDSSGIEVGGLKKFLGQGYGAFMEVYESDSGVYSLVISENAVIFNKTDQKQYDSLVNNYCRYLADPGLLNRNFNSFLNISSALYKSLFGSIKLPEGRIIVSPDQRNFPFEALVTDIQNNRPQYFIQEHPVSYTYSARCLFLEYNSLASKTDLNFSGFAPVHFPAVSNLSGLPGSDKSLDRVSGNFYRSGSFVGSKASKSIFLSQFRNSRIVQLYTHASDTSIFAEPVIWFSDSSLLLSELAGEYSVQTRLLVLAACHTGTGKIYEGEGVFSLGRGFASLGISSVISNLWSVDNQAMYGITELFYKNLASGMPADVSLQRAKLEFMKSGMGRNSLPYYWAGSILMGRADAIEIEKPISTGWYYFFGLIALAGIAAGWKFLQKKS